MATNTCLRRQLKLLLLPTSLTVFTIVFVYVRYREVNTAVNLLSVTVNHKQNESKVYVEDVFMTVKTGQARHKERLDLILNTWFTKVKRDQVTLCTVG